MIDYLGVTAIALIAVLIYLQLNKKSCKSCRCRRVDLNSEPCVSCKEYDNWREK